MDRVIYIYICLEAWIGAMKLSHMVFIGICGMCVGVWDTGYVIHDIYTVIVNTTTNIYESLCCL